VNTPGQDAFAGLIAAMQTERLAHRPLHPPRTDSSPSQGSDGMELVVDGGQTAATGRVISALGFKRLRHQGVSAGPEEYLGLDDATGKLLTLRLHAAPPEGRQREAREKGMLESGGVMIALVGSRGSGKTTVCEALLRWLSPRLEVRGVYFGSGDGPSSLLRWPLRALQRLLTRSGAAPGALPAAGDARPRGAQERAEGTKARGARTIPGFPLVEPVWALLVSREKRRTLKGAWRARANGMVVICDRYPQNEIAGLNDGPFLTRWLEPPRRLFRTLAAWERRPYAWAQMHPPDLIIRLRVSEAMALERRPRTDLAAIRSRLAAIERLTFGDGGRIVDVDADAPLDRVMLAVKRRVWGAL